MISFIIIAILASLSSLTLVRGDQTEQKKYSERSELEINFSDFYEGTFSALDRPIDDVLYNKNCYLEVSKTDPDYVQLMRHLDIDKFFEAGIYYGRFINNNCRRVAIKRTK